MRPVCPLLDARKGEVYVSPLPVDGGTPWSGDSDYLALPPEDVGRVAARAGDRAR